MLMDAPLRRALDAAVKRLLRPLVRLLLRHGVPFSAFEDLAKQVYVDVAMKEFALDRRKPSVSRASILTGLTRKDVQRLLANLPAPDAEPAERYNRATRVMSAWVRDPAFTGAAREARALPLEGDDGFAALVKRHGGDVPARAVLDELLRVGAVRCRDDGLIEPLARAYVPQQGAADKLAILGADVADLITTIDHNLQHGDADPRFQRKVMYHAVPVHALPGFRALSAALAQLLLERLDAWLAEHDDDRPAPGEPAAHARVGLGVHYFEERLPRDPDSKDKT